MSRGNSGSRSIARPRSSGEAMFAIGGRVGLKPERLLGDTMYGAPPMLHRLVEERGIARQDPVLDKSTRDEGTFSRSDFDMIRPRRLTTARAGSISERSATVHEGKTFLYRRAEDVRTGKAFADDVHDEYWAYERGRLFGAIPLHRASRDRIRCCQTICAQASATSDTGHQALRRCRERQWRAVQALRHMVA